MTHQNVNIRLDAELLLALDRALAKFNLELATAGHQQLSRVEFIRKILREYLK
jgi:metal-responsive CopG/Arc/MetJ family transcriptional regulator